MTHPETLRRQLRKNERLAIQIREYWLDRGYDIQLKVTPDGIESDTINATPARKYTGVTSYARK